MTTYDVDWVDAFTSDAFGGNGCAVVHNGAALPDETCIKFVRETSLVECTFTGPSDRAAFRVRYFLASGEIPFAGHPTIATVAALRSRGLVSDGPLVIETLAGLLEVHVNGMTVRMIQNAPTFGATPDKAMVAAVGRLDPEAIASPPQIVSTGLPFCITVLRDRAVLDAVEFDQGAFQRYLDALGAHGTDIMEPFWVVCAPQGTYARLLMAPPSPPEDPFTGSATGAMGAYLWRHSLIKSPTFTAHQGTVLGRPGKALVEVLGRRDEITGVSVTGDAHVLISGTLHL